MRMLLSRPRSTRLPSRLAYNQYGDKVGEDVKRTAGEPVQMKFSVETPAEEEKGNYVTKTEDGYRRIVAAPKPQDIVEIDSIRLLLDAGQVVIAAGGGGIPVLPQNEELKGASAVIEKDLTSGLMAEMLNADMLMILTSVENVSINYGTPDEKPLEHITVADAKKYIAEGQFGENSMLPKMEAAVSFLEKGIGRTAVITSIDSALAGFQGKTGTIIE